MGNKYEVVYDGTEIPGLVETFVRDTNYLLKEVTILERIEDCLSGLIKASVAELNPSAQRGTVWLNRFNARKEGQDAFYIEFSPTEKEQATTFRYVQCVIAEGRFLSKKIRFRQRSDYPSYVTREFIPFLKKFFENFGFEILKEKDSFS